MSTRTASLAAQTTHALKQAWSNLSTHYNQRALVSCTSIQTVINRNDNINRPVSIETIQKGRTYSWISVLNETSTSVFTLAEPDTTKQGKPLMHDDGFQGQILPDPNKLLPMQDEQSDFDVRAASDSVWW